MQSEEGQVNMSAGIGKWSVECGRFAVPSAVGQSTNQIRGVSEVL